MQYIKEMVDQIEDEVKSAKNYAEKYLRLKAAGNTTLASKYKTMAEDEIRHAMVIHGEATEEVEKLSKVYPNPPTEMMDKWEHEHKEAIEKIAWVKHMLTL